jgi:hypothetical protein
LIGTRTKALAHRPDRRQDRRMVRSPSLLACSALLLFGCTPDWQPADPGQGAAVEAFEADGQRMERFTVGGDASSPLADYLFVVDGSVSMSQVLGRFEAGVRSLTEAGVFPERARIAVMNTTPADPEHLDRAHPVVAGKKQAQAAPGFVGLVDAQKLAAYVRRYPRLKEQLPEPGCAAWFAPGDVNANGVPCLIAHAQIDLQPVVAEAGITAFSQLLEAHEGPLFRPGANVNVIFLSDTHDPGVPSHRSNGKLARLDRLIGGQQLAASRPDFAALKAQVEATQPVASFRVHAIAPETECAEPWSEFGPSYFDAVDAAGGQRLDVCTATDYAPFLRSTIEGGSVAQRPVLALGRPLETVVEVTVDELPAPFTIDRGAVVLTDGLPAEPVDVAITYRPRR